MQLHIDQWIKTGCVKIDEQHSYFHDCLFDELGNNQNHSYIMKFIMRVEQSIHLQNMYGKYGEIGAIDAMSI